MFESIAIQKPSSSSLSKTQDRVLDSAPNREAAGFIEVRGARTHNLRSVNCSIPRGRLTVISGVSGSGKSSLAFDTLFAEGQRRYVESLSAYARQFLDRMPRPDVDEIRSLPPAIALEQKNSVKNARSTIGTATEINDYLRLLFAKIGQIHCPECGLPARRDRPRDAFAAIEARDWPDGARFFVLAPIVLDDPALFPGVAAEMRREGFARLRIKGRFVDTTDPAAALPKSCREFEVVADRMVWRRLPPVSLSKTSTASSGESIAPGGENPIREELESRMAAAVQEAFRLSKGRAILWPESGEAIELGEAFGCRQCGKTFRPPEPWLFSFYHPLGACKTCEGFGRTTGLDFDKIIPNPNLSLNECPIAPWNTPTGQEMYDYLRKFRKLKIPWDVPLSQMAPLEYRRLIEGEGDWPGVRGFFRWLEERRYKVQNRIILARYRGYATCPDCKGARLVPEALMVQVGGQTIAQLWARSVRDLQNWFEDEFHPTAREAQTAERILREIRSRLRYLMDVGLGYLTLDRQTRTLSGGEAQRINLAAALGGALTETLYVLDEPTVGLHPRDTDRLLGILRRLTDLSNTAVIVEHDLDVIRSADHLIDLGPWAGEQGGHVIFEGPPGQEEETPSSAASSPSSPKSQSSAASKGGTASSPRSSSASPAAPLSRSCPPPSAFTSLTRQYLRAIQPAMRPLAPASRASAAAQPAPRRREPRGWITIVGACENNLRHLTVQIPLQVFACVTGVSGSGKTTLIGRCLYDNYRRSRGDTNAEPSRILRLEGMDQVPEIGWIDQTPIGRSTRSNPATYMKAWDGIRELLAGTYEARRLGLRPRDFSFNVEGGRCETCKGTGFQTVDMQFLADVTVVCERCEGRRFQDRVLEIRYENYNVSQILNLTIQEALALFEKHPKIVHGLKPLADVGLGYLRLGQNTSTLSGGEAQRLKLAEPLNLPVWGNGALLLLDEPTTGLHPADLEVLLGIFDRLVNHGFSLLVIEHNLELISRADWIIDLGPEGGAEGGDLVASGPPEAIASHPESHTGRFLKNRLSSGS